MHHRPTFWSMTPWVSFTTSLGIGFYLMWAPGNCECSPESRRPRNHTCIHMCTHAHLHTGGETRWGRLGGLTF